MLVSDKTRQVWPFAFVRAILSIGGLPFIVQDNDFGIDIRGIQPLQEFLVNFLPGIIGSATVLNGSQMELSSPATKDRRLPPFWYFLLAQKTLNRDRLKNRERFNMFFQRGVFVLRKVKTNGRKLIGAVHRRLTIIGEG